MTTFAINSVTSLSLGALDTVSVSGIANIKVAAGSTFTTANQGTQVYGPYGVAAAVVITALSAGSYTVTSGGASQFPVIYDGANLRADGAIVGTVGALAKVRNLGSSHHIGYLDNAPNLVSIGTNAGSGRGLDQQVMIPTPFYGVRLFFENSNTAATWTINQINVASANTSLTPDGNGLTWSTALTVAGAGGPFVVPVGVFRDNSEVLPGTLLTDFIPIASIPRTDGGTMPILRIRMHMPDSTLYMANTVSAAMNSDSQNPGFINGGVIASTTQANLLTTAFGSLTAAGGTNTPTGVVFYAAGGCYDMECIGDSLTAGTTTVTQQIGFPQRMSYLAQAEGKTLVTRNRGVLGMWLDDYMVVAKNLLAKYSPTFMCIQSYSPNDVPIGTQATVDRMFGQILDLCQRCKAQGVIPVVMTPWPNNLGSITAPIMQSHINRILALPPWVIVVDANALLRGSSVITYNPLYFTDGSHMNDAGHLVLAQAMLSALGI